MQIPQDKILTLYGEAVLENRVLNENLQKLLQEFGNCRKELEETKVRLEEAMAKYIALDKRRKKEVV